MEEEHNEDCSEVAFPVLGKAYSLCNGAVVSDLSAKIGGADIYEFAEGGNKRSASENLFNGITYYAEQRVANCTAPSRTPVTVNLGSCSTAPTGGSLTAFVNVMYDFQHQTIEAYNTGGGIGTDYEWRASTDGSIFSAIPDAPNSPFFTIPANFSDRYNAGDYKSDTLWFQCKITNSTGTVTTVPNALDIIFIKTNTSGYGIDANGVRYLTLQKGQGGIVGAGTMKVALLNLGQSADWTLAGGYVPNDDAGDLGDFYQWGRVADGHQNVVWSKNESHANQIKPFGETPANTSATADYNSSSSLYDSNKQIKTTATTHYGKFIIGEFYWGPYSNNNSLWGNSTYGNSNSARANLSLLTFPWTYPSNNPCPSGWRVPSRYNLFDLHKGIGDSGADPNAGTFADATDNTWEFRAMQSSPANYAFGGAIITNPSTGEKLFLPASGLRSDAGGGLGDVIGVYWSSTYDSTSYAYTLYFNNSLAVYAGSHGSYSKARGHSVRCVAEF
jgi:uncharacterized protein (TIGR02145 family)